MSPVKSFELTTTFGSSVEAIGLIYEHERDLYMVLNAKGLHLPLGHFTCNTNLISFLDEYYS